MAQGISAINAQDGLPQRLLFTHPNFQLDPLVPATASILPSTSFCRSATSRLPDAFTPCERPDLGSDPRNILHSLLPSRTVSNHEFSLQTTGLPWLDILSHLAYIQPVEPPAICRHRSSIGPTNAPPADRSYRTLWKSHNLLRPATRTVRKVGSPCCKCYPIRVPIGAQGLSPSQPPEADAAANALQNVDLPLPRIILVGLSLFEWGFAFVHRYLLRTQAYPVHHPPLLPRRPSRGLDQSPDSR